MAHAMGQTIPTLQDADRAFAEGRYEEANRMYVVIFAEKNIDTSSQRLKCTRCAQLSKEANDAFREGKYEEALKLFTEILTLNNQDKAAPKCISACNEKMFESILDNAKRLYREGNYQAAYTNLLDYQNKTGNQDPEFLQKVTDCKYWQESAMNAKNAGNLSDAASYYQRILNINPLDAITTRLLAQCQNALAERERASASKKKNVLKPAKNAFSVSVLSGFDNKATIGVRAGFNASYFQIDIDFLTATSYGDLSSPLYKEDASKFIKGERVDGNVTYIKPKFQFAISPGVNLKYFSITCGLGMFLADQFVGPPYDFGDRLPDGHLVNFDDGMKGKVDSKSHFLVRPTLTGNIPFRSSARYGMNVSLGYNIVSGCSKLNGVVFGVGFFF